MGSSISGDTLFTQDIKQSNDGRCTLREAIIAANTDGKSGGKPGECEAGNGADVIELPPGYVYTLSRTDSGNEDSSQTGDLDIVGDITIRSASPGGLVVIEGDAVFTDRIFHVLETGSLKLRDATIRGGNEKNIGGGIYNQHNLELTNVTLTDNSAANSGGALYNEGSATLRYVTLKGNNAASGDGLANAGGTLSLNYSYIEGDSCSGVISAAAGVENLAPVGSGCAASHSEGPGLSLLPYDFDGDGEADYFRLPESSHAVNIATAETACAYASPDPLGMVRPQGATCDLGANEVEYVNQPPDAVDDLGVTTMEDTAVNIDVAANDSDPDGNLDPSSVTVSSVPTHGTALPLAGQPGYITYTPAADYNGADSFQYQICDSEGLCDTAVVSITVTPDSYLEVTQSGDIGPGSLREAISIANGLTTPSTIIFEIPPDHCAPATINVAQALPVIDKQVTIDGLMQEDGACPTAHITLDGGGGSYNGLTIASGVSGAVVRAVTIQNFGLDGVALPGSGAPANGSIIQNTSILNNGRNGVSIGDAASAGDGNSILNNTIAGNCGSGILIFGLGASSGFAPAEINGNLIQGNTIAGNGACGLTVDGTPGGMALNDGITIADGWNNQILDNNIYGSPDLNIDLGGDGPTDNDIDDPDNGANYEQNYPWLTSATPQGEITGFLNSAPDADFTLQFFKVSSCEAGNTGTMPLDVLPFEFTTDSEGIIWFSTFVQDPDSLTFDDNVVSTATDALGNTSEYSNCRPVDDNNTIWNNSWVTQSGNVISQQLREQGQSRWYRFQAGPNSRVTINLSDLPDNYDLALFGNIGLAYASMVSQGNLDLNRLEAEVRTDAFAPSTFSPSTFSPSTFSPSTFSPSTFSPSTFSPSTFSPSTFSPSTFSPSTFSPDVYSPSTFSPSTFSPSTFSPSTFSPSTFSPSTFSPSTFSSNAYSAAQMTTLIAVSGNDGTADEEISFNTYNKQGWFYIRVRGRLGIYNTSSGPFSLGVTVEGGVCEGIQDDFGNAPLLPEANSGRETVIVVDWNRMGLGNPADPDRIALQAKLAQLAAHPTVNGVVVDVGEMVNGQPKYPQVADSNAQADLFDTDSDTYYRLCPYAKNVVADAIKEVIDSYRVNNPVKYVVLVGNDNAIPDYRIADQALLGPEESYVVPVDENSSSEASLRNNYFLSQDGYGSTVNLDMNSNTLPLLTIAVGRLVESPAQIMTVIDAYLEQPVLQPHQALITAYDFLTDNGQAVRDVLAGDGNIAIDQDLLVANPTTWTADQLKNKIDNTDFDLAFLAGHF
ncbi:MAG: Ig-like domain-containing protein, partial [Candidatus Promineifilaceae bacterium]